MQIITIDHYIRSSLQLMKIWETKSHPEFKTFINCRYMDKGRPDLNFYDFLNGATIQAREFIRLYQYNSSRFTKTQIDDIFKIHHWLIELADKDNDTCF